MEDERLERGNNKDRWDKGEIIAKLLGAVIVPTLVACTAYLWNRQNVQQQTSAQMSQIAVSVLQAEDTTNSALRSWAIAVLQNPSSPPTLSKEAASDLEREGLPKFDPAFLKVSPESAKGISDALSALISDAELKKRVLDK